jgi:glycerophosphoryl diester phosphodiesterase
LSNEVKGTGDLALATAQVFRKKVHRYFKLPNSNHSKARDLVNLLIIMVFEIIFAHVPILVASVKIWCILYSLLLLSSDIVFTFFPSTFLGILTVYGLLYYFRLEPVNTTVVNRVLGLDLLKSDKSLPWQTTSRLLQATAGKASSVTAVPDPNLNGTTKTADTAAGGSTSSDVSEFYSMQIIGHRGAGLDSPENTLAAFRNCKFRGCTAVEFDVGLTKDGIPVLFHDDDLMRMTGVNKKLKDVTWDEIKNLELLHPLSKKFSHERIPLFKEGIQTCLELDLRFFIDIKDSGTIPHILEAYKSTPRMYDRAIVSSFNLKIVYDLRRSDPNIMGCCAWRPGFFRYKTWDGSLKNLEKWNTLFLFDWLAVVADWIHLWFVTTVAWWFVGMSVVLLNKDGVRTDDLSRWSRRGIRTFLWTVNNPIEKLHVVQNFRTGYLTDTLEMPRIQSSSDFLTPIQKSEVDVSTKKQ